MNDLPERWLRSLRRSLFILVLALAGCGPGGGGTGTGPIGIQFFTATTSLGTTQGSVTGLPVPIVPGAAVRVDLQLQNTSVEFTTDCGRFVFTGDWSANAGTTVVLPGRFESGTRSTIASLRLQFSDGAADSRTVTLTLLDAQGQVLLGPVVLNRADSLPGRPATAPAGCV